MPEMTDQKQCVSDVMTTVHVIGIPWFASCLSQARYPESRLTVSRLLSRTQPRVSGLVSRAGFTILELITVLVVGGVLTSFAMGRVTQIMSSQRLKAVALADAGSRLAPKSRATLLAAILRLGTSDLR